MELLRVLAVTILAFTTIAAVIYLIFSVLQNKKSKEDSCQAESDEKPKTFGCACGAGVCDSKE
jgi:hypothetical protein